ncbi:MAG: sigma-70 family RNA polymerase sigma factor [Clostridia bacterium]|nr:sigma-70 family RNA polymerase sigma factor [Clostridia bacterium]
MQLLNSHHPITDSEFTELVEQKQGSFYRVAYGYAKNQEDALEIVQETVCKAFAGKHRLKDATRFYPWFYRILANTAVSFLRKRSTFLPLEEWSETPTSEGEENRDEAIWLKDELRRLDAKSRTVVIFKIYEDMTFREIAEVMKKPESTIKSEYYRGLNLLKERMNLHAGELERDR